MSLPYARQKPHSWSGHNLFRHVTCSGSLLHPLVSIRPLSCLHQIVYKSSTTSSSDTSLFPAATLHRHWFFSDRPGILSTQGRLRHINDGANAPWKNRGGDFFCRNLRNLGEEVHKLFIHSPPLSFCNKFPLQNKNLLYWHSSVW